jgi:uncharacterized membrane protein
MHPSKLQRGEFVAMVGGALLAVGLFLTWYATKGNGRIDGAAHGGKGDFTGWEIHTILRWLLIAAAAAPFILAYIIVRDHKLSWPRGELTAVIAIAAFGLIAYNGVIARPGTSSSLVSLQTGWFVAVAGTLLMLAGSAGRASKVERKRKPPGTI